jgi:hypothetical protein
MSTAEDQRAALVRLLLDEVSDVDLVCYLARSGGDALLRDLFESVRDVAFLSADDLLYNIKLLRQKKAEASSYPMHPVFQRLMNPPDRQSAIAINGTPPAQNGSLNLAQH